MVIGAVISRSIINKSQQVSSLLRKNLHCSAAAILPEVFSNNKNNHKNDDTTYNISKGSLCMSSKMMRSTICTSTSGRRMMSSTNTNSNNKIIQRIGTDDPRMSKIVIHNGIIYMSGLTDTTSTGIQGQTENVLKKVDDLLEQAGTSKSNLLSAQIWLKDIESDFKTMNVVWCNYVDPNNKPVRATVQSPMARPQILIEIQVTAAVPTTTTTMEDSIISNQNERDEWEKHHFRMK